MGRNVTAYLAWGKRSLDLGLSAVGLVILSPVLALISLSILAILGRPILYRHRRPGMNEEPFILLKFRTMSSATAPDGRPLPDGERLGAFGRILRSTSLDELPELWNVLKGEMSLVGPRPLLMEYLPLYSEQQRRRHSVRPGITGWAQVNGRNSLSWEQKFDLDVWYVDHASACVDLRILARTAGAVFMRRGIAAAGEATMPPFRGAAAVPAGRGRPEFPGAGTL